MTDKQRLFEEFLASPDTFRVYQQGQLVFSSRKERLQPIIDYMDRATPPAPGTMVFDRIVGNAAALLLKQIGCGEIHAPLGSELAAKTLQQFGISHRFITVVPYIVDKTGADMCPMERLSLDKTPEEFCSVLRHMRHITRAAHSKN